MVDKACLLCKHIVTKDTSIYVSISKDIKCARITKHEACLNALYQEVSPFENCRLLQIRLLLAEQDTATHVTYWFLATFLLKLNYILLVKIISLYLIWLWNYVLRCLNETSLSEDVFCWEGFVSCPLLSSKCSNLVWYFKFLCFSMWDV